MTIFTIGDSIAHGMAATLGSVDKAVVNGRVGDLSGQIDQIQGQIQRGDTIVLSIGYNSATPTGLSAADLQTIQAQVSRLTQAGATVLIPGLRTRGMTSGAHGNFATLNDNADGTPGIASRINEQLGRITGARLLTECTTQANGQSNGDPHAFAAELARICQAAAASSQANTAPAAPAAPETGNGTGNGNGANPSAEADNNSFFRNLFVGLSQIPLIGGLFRMLGNLFGMNIPEPTPSGASAPATGTGGTGAQAQGAPDAQTLAAARAAGQGSPAAGTGADADVAMPSLPAARGPLVQGARG